MKRAKREDIIAAPLIAGVVGLFTYFVLYYLAGLKNMAGDIVGVEVGLFISAVMSVIVAAILFGELLASALEK